MNLLHAVWLSAILLNFYLRSICFCVQMYLQCLSVWHYGSISKVWEPLVKTNNSHLLTTYHVPGTLQKHFDYIKWTNSFLREKLLWLLFTAEKEETITQQINGWKGFQQRKAVCWASNLRILTKRTEGPGKTLAAWLSVWYSIVLLHQFLYSIRLNSKLGSEFADLCFADHLSSLNEAKHFFSQELDAWRCSSMSRHYPSHSVALGSIPST